MKRTYLFAGVVAIILIVAVVVSLGGKTSENDLIGTWELCSNGTDVKKITFYSDGTCLVADENGTWDFVDGQLRILGPYGGKFWDHDNIIGETTIENDQLIISNPIVDGRQKNYDVIYQKID